MDGIHDMGGRQGFGPVGARTDEPVFAADWERHAFALSGVLLLHGLATMSSFRHAIERMDPGHYLTSSYYEHWTTAIATLVAEAGVASAQELADLAGGEVPLSRPAVTDGQVGPAAEAPYAVGDEVRVRDVHPSGHTRLPGYVRGRRGRVVRVDPAYVVPDEEAHVAEPASEATYGVRFEARELWGRDGDPVHVDLWQRYLEAAP
ncbi:MAG TPA: nitrile hydratase subunit beta [Mycobacteriales bacterium]|jgi:nitrile hydratase|nr:nitrile hydratase subunit beta [Mycobacteriales bacterium]